MSNQKVTDPLTVKRARENAEQTHLGWRDVEKDAIVGRVFYRYWDRLADPTPDDPLDKIVDELLQALQDAERGYRDE